MNLYFRLIYTVLRAVFFARKITALEWSELKFRALPTDCDMNLHITNSRYLSFMDLGRTYLMGQLKLISMLYKKRWAPVIQATELTYLKPIMLGQAFQLRTRLLYWDAKYFYMEQRFYVATKLCAVAIVKGLFLGRDYKVPTAKIIALLGESVQAPSLPEVIAVWQQLSRAKKTVDDA